MRTLVSAALLVLAVSIAGCASISSSEAALPAPAALLRHGANDGASGKLFVSDYYVSEILIYPAHAKNPAPTGSITSGVSYPYNLAVDRSGTLYVQNNNNTITEYSTSGSGPTKTLDEPKVGYGTGICVTVGDDGTVYAVDHLAGQIYEFKNGSESPTTTIDLEHAFGLALDSKNDLYAGYTSSSSGYYGRVERFKPGKTGGRDLGISVKLQGGLAVDKHNDLLVGDQGNKVIDIYKPGATTPFRTIDTSPAYPYQFAFDRKERYLYLVSGEPAEVYVYDYATGKLAWTDTQGLSGSKGYAEGVALSPAAPQ